MKNLCYITGLIILFSCNEVPQKNILVPEENIEELTALPTTSIVILGTIQDAGSPQIACTKKCCKDLFETPDHTRKVVSLGLIDNHNKKKFIFEATPDFVSQSKILKNHCDFKTSETPDGVFLSHAHIGHYTGLMYLGKEAMNADQIAVYAMPKMKTFLSNNGPWDQLVSAKNIALHAIYKDQPIMLCSDLKVIPFLVPHRDEYSETVGYKIIGPNKSALFIPDIDKWNKWETDIIKAIKEVDYAFIDATFYDGEELDNRDISEIPHPFIIESMKLFKFIPEQDKDKIYFIHFNHTNPVLNDGSRQAERVRAKGFHIAQFNDVFNL